MRLIPVNAYSKVNTTPGSSFIFQIATSFFRSEVHESFGDKGATASPNFHAISSTTVFLLALSVYDRLAIASFQNILNVELPFYFYLVGLIKF